MRIEIKEDNDIVDRSNIPPGTILQSKSDKNTLVLYWGDGINKTYFQGIELSDGKEATLYTGNKEDYKLFSGSVTLTQQ